MKLEELRSHTIAVLGYGANHVGLVSFLLSQEIKITIRDKDPLRKQEFEQRHPRESHLVTWEILPNILSGLNAFSLVFRSPAFPVLASEFAKYKKKGGIVYSQTRLFFDLCPAKIIGVTGTKGKGTTSSLITKVLEDGWKEGKVFLGGNIGKDPFEFYGQLGQNDVVVLELSSFQIQDLEVSPHIVVLLNVGVDHLDHHKTVQEYEEAKANLLQHQKPDDIAVINIENPDMQRYAKVTSALTYLYSRHTPRRHAAWADRTNDQEIIFVQTGDEVLSFDSSGRKLLGEHNLDNILPAVIVGRLLGVNIASIGETVNSFAGLEHRLSLVGTFGGVDFYEDSFATTPESSAVAVEAFAGRRIHLVAGGNDKGGDYGPLGAVIAHHCVSLHLLPGTASKKIRKAVEKASKNGITIQEYAQSPLFPMILSGIHLMAKEGDVVLLSPAATSFASFKNYKERGDLFAKAVRERYDKQ